MKRAKVRMIYFFGGFFVFVFVLFCFVFCCNVERRQSIYVYAMRGGGGPGGF